MTLNSSYDKAFDAACRKLAARMRTEKEIRLHLKKLGFDDETTEAAVAELKNFRYIDDERYCREYFKYAKAKGKADARIVMELAEKGISRETARNVIEDVRDTEPEYRSDRQLAYETGLKLLHKQFEEGKEVDQKFLARVGRRLAGLGYDSGTIYSVLGKLRQDGRDKTGSVSEDEKTYW